MSSRTLKGSPSCSWLLSDRKMMKMLVVFGILLHVSLKVLAVEMYEGESILLDCEFATDEFDQPSVLWTRPDLSPSIVHQLQPEGDILQDQNKLFRGRTSMKTDALKTGDLSINLTNLQLSDNGTYTCSVKDFSVGEVKVTDRELMVKEKFPFWAKFLLGVAIVLAVVVAVIVYCFRHYMKREVQVEVDSGEEFVLLPCRYLFLRLPEDFRVEWRDSRLCNVHQYENYSDHLEEQHEFYNKRTKMKEDLLETRDLSLTLKYPTDWDSDIFTCSVYNREGTLAKKRRVNLKVKVHQVEVEEGVESVQLPFITTPELPEDARVDWRDQNDRKVHIYENCSDQSEEQHQSYRNRTRMDEDPLKTGDLSLTLLCPTSSDSGQYRCRIWLERKQLRLKTLQLEVKAGKVQVQPEETSTSFIN